MYKIQKKINMTNMELRQNGAITIVAFGDSITQGVTYGKVDYENVYWNRLRKKINAVKEYIPVNIINSGIEGTSATVSLDRIETQVLTYCPDLVIVCFGLNDINGTLQEYLQSLKTIFEKIQAKGIDLIFMTPNMLNTYVAEDVDPKYAAYAVRTAQMQNEGKMDLFMNEAKRLAEEMRVCVCDCYSKWKELSKTQDTTVLLANRINHPTAEMHELFAQSLFDIIFEGYNFAV